MAGGKYTSPSIPINSKLMNGGLNSTAGPIALQENESSDLQNIDFDKFGSILKRGGYVQLNTTATTGTNLTGDGLYWYEFNSAGTNTRYLTHVSGGKIMYDSGGVSGTWTNLTGAYTATALSHCDFSTFLNKVFITNGVDIPTYWDGTATANNMASVLTSSTGITSAKYNCLFNNYLFLGNVNLGGVYHPNRIYWSNVEDPFTWLGQNWIEVSWNDGDEITGLHVLADRLVIYKNRSIYNLYFTGDADIPFILPGGGKTNSNVGCIAPWSVQEVNNGHVFLSYDGIYYFDGNNSYRLSDKIRSTLLTYQFSKYPQAVSTIYRSKCRYLLAMASEGNTNNKIVAWDFYNNAFSIYSGIGCSDMAEVFVNGTEERIYFSDYNGYTYRQDIGSTDYPSGVATAINAYYYTNWKTFDDLVNKKGILNALIYYQLNSATMIFSYSYDFAGADQYITTFNTSGNQTAWNNFVWGFANWGGSGGAVVRKDLNGRGRAVRVKFANATIDETFRIDGVGLFTNLETNV